MRSDVLEALEAELREIDQENELLAKILNAQEMRSKMLNDILANHRANKEAQQNIGNTFRQRLEYGPLGNAAQETFTPPELPRIARRGNGGHAG